MNNIDARELVANRLHFIGVHGCKTDQLPEEKEKLKEIDKAIDEAVANVARETGKRITITEGDRYELRWEYIRGMLIDRGCDPGELDAMAEAVREATREAIADHKKRVDSFKIVK